MKLPALVHKRCLTVNLISQSVINYIRGGLSQLDGVLETCPGQLNPVTLGHVISEYIVN